MPYSKWSVSVSCMLVSAVQFLIRYITTGVFIQDHFGLPPRAMTDWWKHWQYQRLTALPENNSPGSISHCMPVLMLLHGTAMLMVRHDDGLSNCPPSMPITSVREMCAWISITAKAVLNTSSLNGAWKKEEKDSHSPLNVLGNHTFRSDLICKLGCKIPQSNFKGSQSLPTVPETLIITQTHTERKRELVT